MSQEFSPTKAAVEIFKDRMEGFSVMFDSDEDAIRFMQQLFADFERDQKRTSKSSGK